MYIGIYMYTIGFNSVFKVALVFSIKRQYLLFNLAFSEGKIHM